MKMEMEELKNEFEYYDGLKSEETHEENDYIIFAEKIDKQKMI